MAKKSRSRTISLLASFIGILCLYFPVTTTTAAEAAAESDAAVDFLYLTFVWPGAYCYSGKCCRPTTADAHEPAYDFLIEDMKTYDSRTGEIVKNCNTTCRFSVNKIKSLIPDLYTHWYSFSCPSNNNKDSWNNAWCTYGQCSKLNQSEYFKAAFNIMARANLLEVLKVNNIEPSSSVSYKLRDIETALMANLGLSTHVECVTKTVLWWKTTLLSKIHVCVSANGKSVIGCPIEKKATCDDDVRFYPFTSNDLKPSHSADAGSGGLIDMVTEKYLAM